VLKVFGDIFNIDSEFKCSISEERDEIRRTTLCNGEYALAIYEREENQYPTWEGYQIIILEHSTGIPRNLLNYEAARDHRRHI